jgi:hypothetical protein
LSLLGMRDEGQGDYETEAHPRLRILMNLRSGSKDHTHTFVPFCRTKSLQWSFGMG